LSDKCRWLHEQLEQLRLVRFPFKLKELPKNGIYFFYERDEKWGHYGNKQRIVRIGTHRDGNFRNRIAEHFLLDIGKMNFDLHSSKPSDRSIFRKNIGRALLNRRKDPYLKIWEIDFMKRKNREKIAQLRNIEKEKNIESKITAILRDKFSFRFIELKNQAERMGKGGLESSLIGTVSQCSICKPSESWLGLGSPKKHIRESGLWLVQHLKADPINEADKKTIIDAIKSIQRL